MVSGRVASSENGQRSPSALDALMHGARAAAALKKRPPLPSPSRKSKSHQPSSPYQNPGNLETTIQPPRGTVATVTKPQDATETVQPINSEKGHQPLSAFDALKSGAHAAAAEKKRPRPPPPHSSSPKKRKFPHFSAPSQNPKTVETAGAIEIVEKPRETAETVQPPIKGRHNDEFVLALKERVLRLKKKPPEFDPATVACWDKGQPVPFLFLCLGFDMIGKETRRIVKTDIMCNLLRTVIYSTPEDLAPVVYLSATRIAPAHEGLELGIGGDATITNVLAKAYGSKKNHIKTLYEKEGDLGLVAQACRSSQPMIRKPVALTIRKVFDTFRRIAKESGKDSQEKKMNHIKSLLIAAVDCEPQYLIRLLQSNLRIGFAAQTLLASLGQAAVYTEEHSKPPPEIQSPLEEAAKIVQQAYSVLPDYDKIISALLTGGVWTLPKTCNVTPGVPVQPMLANTARSVSEVLNKFVDVEQLTCEYKYDGQRAQIHYMENGLVEIYSRSAERNTGMFPDVVAAVSRLKKTTVSSFILDCELVAYDRAKQKILPFQELRTRRQKNVVESNISVDVCIFAFDLIYLNGQALIKENLGIRREHLYASFEEETGFFQFATSITSNDDGEILNFFKKAVDASCEGLMIKTFNNDATYEFKRSLNWLKLKKDYLKNIGDSLDLVPIAAYYGHGKRTGDFGAFLLACYDNNKDEFQSICKLGSGFCEDLLEKLSADLRSKVIPKPKAYYQYGETMEAPDVWLDASEVWEVEASDLTISPTYRAAAGLVHSHKGISLRMPRFVRVRPDKSPDQASSSELVAEMYNAQKINHATKQDDDEE